MVPLAEHAPREGPSLAVLRARHGALAAKLTAVAGQLRPLVADKAGLLAETRLAAKAVEAELGPDAWAKGGEDGFWHRSGWTESSDALGDVENALNDLEEAGEAEGERLAEMAEETSTRAVGAERARVLDRAAEVVRRALVEAAWGVREVRNELQAVYPNDDDVDTDGDGIESLLAHALLLVEMGVEEGTDRLRRELDRVAEGVTK